MDFKRCVPRFNRIEVLFGILGLLGVWVAAMMIYGLMAFLVPAGLAIVFCMFILPIALSQ